MSEFIDEFVFAAVMGALPAPLSDSQRLTLRLRMRLALPVGVS